MSTKLWFGTEASFHELVSIEEKIANASEELRLKADAWEMEDDGEDCHWMLQMEGKLAIIDIRGSMSAGYAGFWGMYFGYVGYDDIKEALNDGLEKGATDFLLVWDTSGGSVDGIEEMSQFLRDLRKLDNVNSLTSFTSSTAASAGVWLATEADKFYATPMAQVGSIGVLAVHREYTKQMEMYGIKATVFRSAKYKALGNPYEALSEIAKKKIEDDIAKAHEFFVEAISLNRGMTKDYVSTELATGEMWYAEDAKQRNLIDGVKLFNQVFVALSKKSNENTVNYQSRPTEVDMKKTRLSPQAAAAIAAGAPVDKVLENEDENSTEEEDVDTTKDVPEEDETDTSVDGDKSEDEKDKTDEGKSASAPADLVKSFTDMSNQLVDARVALGAAEAALSAEKAKVATLEASNNSMKQIVAGYVQKACVGVGSPAPNLDSLLSMDTSALIEQHAQAAGLLQQRYPSNGRISREVDETDKEAQAMAAVAAHNDEILLGLATIKPNRK